MQQSFTPAPHDIGESGADTAWTIVRHASDAADRLAEAKQPAAFAVDANAALVPVAIGAANAVLTWHPDAGWACALPPTDPQRAALDLYLPVASATTAHPITVGHLGQSLDGFIATHTGESQWVTGQENVVHMHRLRALCDAVIVGAGTVAADDPELTTRLVPGTSPLRVVIDPSRRLGDHHRVFTSPAAETLYVCAEAFVQPGEHRFGQATIVGISSGASGPGNIDLAELMQLLHRRGCARVFVEGGGVTVSMFLEANLLDRLHVAVAPFLIGDGRPAIRLPARAALDECHRPSHRIFRMGGDVLFDFDLRADEPPDGSKETPAITRII